MFPNFAAALACINHPFGYQLELSRDTLREYAMVRIRRGVRYGPEFPRRISHYGPCGRRKHSIVDFVG